MPPKKTQTPPEEVKSDLSDAILRGEDAKRLREDPYFQSLTERMDKAYQSEVLSLHPAKADRFTAIQERRQGLHDLIGSIIADVEAGTKALAAAQGQALKKGRVA
jgi:uncharacterized protein YdcH (DUF465 family)